MNVKPPYRGDNSLVYNGRHRDVEMLKGVGYIPLGDRTRACVEYAIEERDSIDRYAKWSNLSN